jgi:hypothetical protein
MPWPQTPGSIAKLAFSLKQYPAFQHMNTVGSPNMVNFRGSIPSLALRPITPVYQLHTFGYPLVCGIGVRLVANLCLIRTLTGKNCQAFLAHTRYSILYTVFYSFFKLLHHIIYLLFLQIIKKW